MTIAAVLSGDRRWHVEHGDNRAVLAALPDACFDAVVCDPPYELGFMGKSWDASGIAYSVDLWRDVLRVLKPGGHLVAFGGTRTYHRMTCAIEDAGFEVRDCLAWLYGSGFPKSLDVSKAIDSLDAVHEQTARRLRFTEWVRSQGVTSSQIDAATNTNMGSHYTTAATQPAIMTREHLEMCRQLFRDVPEWVEREADIRSVDSANMASRETTGSRRLPDFTQKARAPIAAQGISATPHREVALTLPATAAAKEWHGWGTALKPAHEPAVLARKPLRGTVAANVVAHGTGTVNVDGCRIGDAPGRWPANVLLTHAPDCGDACAAACPVRMLDEQSGHLPAGKFPGRQIAKPGAGGTMGSGWTGAISPKRDMPDSGGASRFFYTAKASTSERERGLEHRRRRKVNDGREAAADNPRLRGETERANIHPTVKPIDLMRWLVRLVTPPGGVVLDLFAGSGSTIIAALAEGMRGVGIELDAEHVAIARDRIVGDMPLLNREET